MKRLILAILAVALASCSTVGRDIGFAGEAGQAFVVLSVDGIGDGRGHTFTFQRVDLATSAFQRQFVSITFSPMGPLMGDEFRTPEGLRTTRRFGGARLPAGDYALISRTDVTTYGTGGTSSMVDCYSLGAPVFRMRDGAINIIPLDAMARRSEAESEVAMVLAGYPNMTARQSVAETLGGAAFETQRWLGGQTCNASGPFTFAPAR